MNIKLRLSSPIEIYCIFILDVSARNMVSGNSAHRDDRLDSVRMPQKTRSRNCSGDGSSDSGSSMNENNPARVKHNTTGDNRKEHIQGNSSYIHTHLFLKLDFLLH